jgi:hypothetical protein
MVETGHGAAVDLHGGGSRQKGAQGNVGLLMCPDLFLGRCFARKRLFHMFHIPGNVAGRDTAGLHELVYVAINGVVANLCLSRENDQVGAVQHLLLTGLLSTIKSLYGCRPYDEALFRTASNRVSTARVSSFSGENSRTA